MAAAAAGCTLPAAGPAVPAAPVTSLWLLPASLLARALVPLPVPDRVRTESAEAMPAAASTSAAGAALPAGGCMP